MVALESKLFALQFDCLIETEINQSQIEYFNRIRRLISVVKYIIYFIHTYIVYNTLYCSGSNLLEDGTKHITMLKFQIFAPGVGCHS